MRILLKGYYGYGNLGDDLLFMFVFDFLKDKYPSASIDVYSNNTINNPSSDYDPNYHRYLLKLRPGINQLIDWSYNQNYDLIVDGGGGIYFDHQSANFFLKLLNHSCSLISIQLLLKVETFLRSILGRKPRINGKKVGLGISIGPYDFSSKKYLRHHIDVNSYDSLLIRDSISSSYVKNQKIYLKSTLDLVFASQELTRKNPNSSSVKEIGIVALKWHHDSEVLLFNVITSAKELERNGYKLTFFLFDSHNDNSLVPLLHEFDIVQWNPNNYEQESFFDVFSRMDIIMSMRYHGCVLATCLGIPTIILAVSQKLNQLMNQIPKSNIAVDLPLEPRKISSAVKKIEANYDSYQLESSSYKDSFRGKVKNDISEFWEQLN